MKNLRRLSLLFLIRNKQSVSRWIIIGVLTNFFDYLLFISIYIQIKSVLISNLISTSCAPTINYYGHYRWTFASDQKHFYSGRRYLMNLFVLWIVSSLIIKFLINLGADPKIAKLVPLFVIAPINFFTLNKLVFKKKY